MKKLLLFFILITQLLHSQEYNNDSGIFQYKTIDSTTLSLTELKSAISKWCAINLKNSNYAVQLNNDDNIIVKTGSYINTRGEKTFIEFTLDFSLKDNRYKIEAYDFPLVMTTLGYKTHIYNPEFYTKDLYKKETLEMIEQLSFGKNAAKKRMENERVFNKYYELQLEDINRIFNHTKGIMDNISLSIKNSINKHNTDW